MNKSSLVVIWLLFFLAIFAIGFATTHIVYEKVMAELEVEPEPVYTQTLQVKPNHGSQTKQYKPLQPAVTPIGKEW